MIFFDDVVADPLGVLDELQAALGLPYYDFQPLVRRSRGRFRVEASPADRFASLMKPLPKPRPPMRADTRQFLRSFYRPWLRRLWTVLRDRGRLHHVLPPTGWTATDSDEASRFRRRRSPRVWRAQNDEGEGAAPT